MMTNSMSGKRQWWTAGAVIVLLGFGIQLMWTSGLSSWLSGAATGCGLTVCQFSERLSAGRDRVRRTLR